MNPPVLIGMPEQDYILQSVECGSQKGQSTGHAEQQFLNALSSLSSYSSMEKRKEKSALVNWIKSTYYGIYSDLSVKEGFFYSFT